MNLQESRGNELIVQDGKLTGEVKEPILGRAAKLATLIELREAFDLDNIDTLVVGDGANDLGMIGEAGLGVAFHAKPAVAASAAARIDYGDLTALLYAQGYRREEFVGDDFFGPHSSSPAKAGDPVLQRQRRQAEKPGVLDTPPTRGMTTVYAEATARLAPRSAIRPRRSTPGAARISCRPSSTDRRAS